MGIQFQQIGDVHGLMGIHFETGRGIIICMNLKESDETSIFINYNAPFYFVTLLFPGQ